MEHRTKSGKEFIVSKENDTALITCKTIEEENFLTKSDLEEMKSIATTKGIKNVLLESKCKIQLYSGKTWPDPMI